MASFPGTDGDDNILGTALGDVINGLAGSDTLAGQAGNDTINPGSTPDDGRDRIFGSTGDDEIVFSDAVPTNGYVQLTYSELNGVFVTLDGPTNTGNVLKGPDGTDTLIDVQTALASGDLNIWASSGNDTLTVNGGADTWMSLGGSEGRDLFNITLTGTVRLIYDGSWSLFAEQGVIMNLTTGVVGNDGFGFDDQINVTDGDGVLEIFASAQSDNITGGSNAIESYVLLGGQDTLNAVDGFDAVRYDWNGFTSAVTVDLAAGTATGLWDDVAFNHILTGVEGVLGTGYGDTVSGSALADRLFGYDGNDRLEGSAGNDTMEGGRGADTLIGGDGGDALFGSGAGNSLRFGDADYTDDLRDVIYGGEGNDSIDGGYGNDELRGDAGNDTVAGGFGADTVIGGAGDDVLTGSAFGDVIFGSDGNDFINGGFGFDRVNGGAGADRFYHLGVRDHGSDWIQDYNSADGDVLQFGGLASTAASDFLIQRATTATAGADGVQEIFVTQISTGNLLWALVDGDAQAQINIQIGAQVFDLLA